MGKLATAQNECRLKARIPLKNAGHSLSGSYDTATTSGRICRATWSDRVSSTISMSYRL
jgi:hypothetical protein